MGRPAATARSGYMPTLQQRQDFGAALRRARTRAGMTQTQVAVAVDRGQSTVVAWEKGETTPQEFALVFALEELLGAEPGALSQHLGFQPVSADCPPCDVIAAIRNDPALDDRAKGYLMASYRAALAEMEQRRPG